MQNLTRIIKSAKEANPNTYQLLNLIREYLQIRILKTTYESKYGPMLSFHGGTCLRICNDLKRYSEDLDFTLDRNKKSFVFSDLNLIIEKSLASSGFNVQLDLKKDVPVNNAHIRFQNILNKFGIDHNQAAKLMVKLEVDTNPVRILNDEVESYFVTKFDEIFPIIKHKSETLFAGKVCAILTRTYLKGRDYYDLIWYLNKKTEFNFDYFNRLMKQANLQIKCTKRIDIIALLKEKFNIIDTKAIVRDLERFLEDRSEVKWFGDFLKLFEQISKKWLDSRENVIHE